MVVHINLQSGEHTQFMLLSEGVRELNSMMTATGGSPVVLESKDGSLCSAANDGSLVTLTVDSLAVLLRPTCIPGRLKHNDEDPEDPIFVEEPCLPRSLMRAYMESRTWIGVPTVRQVARAPIVRPDFTVRWEPGWDEDTQCWVLPGLTEDRTMVDAKFDVRTIFNAFPFADRRLVADALAAAFTPLLSTAINGALPGLIITARKPGSGKTELAKFCSLIGNGGKTFTTWRGVTELEKMIGTYVAEDSRVVIFDNIKNDIDSPIMESVITARTVSYRKMYSHSSVSLRSNTSWFMTANGAIVSQDMVRRSIVILLDKENTPGIKEWADSMPSWVEGREAMLVTLMCHMIENWRIAGCTPGSVSFSNFDEWSRVVSGILEANGIGGMWEAREEIVGESIQTDDEDDIPIVEAIAAVMGSAEFKAGDLWEKVNDTGSSAYLDSKCTVVREWLKTTGKVKGSSRASIPTGRALHTLDGKRFSGCNIMLESKIVSGRKWYECTTLDGSTLPSPGSTSSEFGPM